MLPDIVDVEGSCVGEVNQQFYWLRVHSSQLDITQQFGVRQEQQPEVLTENVLELKLRKFRGA